MPKPCCIFFFIMILKQDEVAVTSVVRAGPPHREKKNVFKGPKVKVSVDDDLEIIKVITGQTDEGSEFESLEVIGISELPNDFVRLESNIIAKGGCISRK